MISPAIAAIAIGVLTMLAFGGGFAVSDWRNGAEMQRLKSDNRVLQASNTQCATDIGAVRTRITEIMKESEVRTKAAAVEMDNAQVQAATHSRTAIVIKAAPIVAPDKQCEAVEREQIEYVNSRRADAS